jgi:putative MATE family efflux protein
MTENTEKLKTMKIGKLIMVMSLPAITSMIVQALYNVVDSIFVSELGEKALTALALVYPLQLVIIAIFAGIGVGVNVGISRNIGASKIKDATITAEHGIFIGLILWVILAILSFFVPGKFIGLFTEDPVILQYATSYLQIIMLFSLGSIMAEICMNIVRATGDAKNPMKIQLLGAITNIVLDPLLIFGVLFFPKLGITGAAIATVAGQIASMIYGIYCVNKSGAGIKFSLKGFHYKSSIAKDILLVCVPATFMIGLQSVMLCGINFILTNESEIAIAVFGIYFKLQAIVTMALVGLTQGITPIMAFNYGLKNKKRLMDTLKYSLVIASGLMILGTLIFNIFPLQLLALFNSTPESQQIGVSCLRICSLGYLFAGIGLVFATFFQAVGKPLHSMVLTFSRQILFLLTIAYLLYNTIGLVGVWMAFPISEFLCAVVACVMMLAIYKREINLLGYVETDPIDDVIAA